MKRTTFLFSFLVLAAMAFASCGGSDGTDKGRVVKPDGGGSEKSVVSGAKPRVIWIESYANFYVYGDHRDYIERDLKRIKDMGFTDIVVDVRPSNNGGVLYKSSHCQPIVDHLGAHINGHYEIYHRTETWDYLQAFIDIGHKLGLKVNAGFNTFIGGYLNANGDANEGPVFHNPEMRDWVTVVNRQQGLFNLLDINSSRASHPGLKPFFGEVFLNPCNDDVQTYVLQLLRDLVVNYPGLDGVVLDRCRFMSMIADFSQLTKRKFIAYLNQEKGMHVSDLDWPESVATPEMRSVDDVPAGQLPPYFKDFLAFRAKTIYDFVVKARATVKGANPKLRFGTYCGAWYESYYENGVNWGSRSYDPSREFSAWANADYRKYGYAEQLDFLLLGAYCSGYAIYGSSEWTMQGFGLRARRFTAGKVKYALGPDVGNPPGFNPKDSYLGSRAPQAVTQTVDACINSADGYFLFDLCHVRMFNYWSAVKTGISNYLSSLAH